MRPGVKCDIGLKGNESNLALFLINTCTIVQDLSFLFHLFARLVVALDIQVCARRNPRLDRHKRANVILLEVLIL